MRTWLLLLGGLIVWAVQFFALYIVASIFGSAPIARISTALITLACLAADAAILVAALRARLDNGFGQWVRSLAVTGAAFSIVAVLWQGLPALIS